jgi:hypothetical protein
MPANQQGMFLLTGGSFAADIMLLASTCTKIPSGFDRVGCENLGEKRKIS